MGRRPGPTAARIVACAGEPFGSDTAQDLFKASGLFRQHVSYGVQRLVPLGRATDCRPDLPQDAIEPVRRMVRWISDESCDRVAASGPAR